MCVLVPVFKCTDTWCRGGTGEGRPLQIRMSPQIFTEGKSRARELKHVTDLVCSPVELINFFLDWVQEALLVIVRSYCRCLECKQRRWLYIDSINETWKHRSFREMEWKEIDPPRLDGAYFVSLFLLWSRYTIKLIYTQDVRLVPSWRWELTGLDVEGNCFIVFSKSAHLVIDAVKICSSGCTWIFRNMLIFLSDCKQFIDWG